MSRMTRSGPRWTVQPPRRGLLAGTSRALFRRRATSCQRLPKLAARPHQPGLDRSCRYAQQDRRLACGQSVEHRGANHRPQFGRQMVHCPTEVAVLDADEHLFLRRRCLITVTQSPQGETTPTKPIDQAANSYAPDPGGHLTTTLLTTFALPDRDKGVLGGLVDHCSVGAPSAEPHRHPTNVAQVQRM